MSADLDGPCRCCSSHIDFILFLVPFCPHIAFLWYKREEQDTNQTNFKEKKMHKTRVNSKGGLKSSPPLPAAHKFDSFSSCSIIEKKIGRILDKLERFSWKRHQLLYSAGDQKKSGQQRDGRSVI